MGIIFIGFGSYVFEMVGNKVIVKEYVIVVGVFVLKYMLVFCDVDELVVGVDEIGFLIFVKVVVGGGGCGMCWVEKKEDLKVVFEVVMCEVDSVFGDLMMFFE